MANVRIDPELCKGCGLCIRYCPLSLLEKASALNSRGETIACLPEEAARRCTACGCCYQVCPDGAICVMDGKENA